MQYALESSSLPIGVSDYVLERFIPADFKSQMPTIEEVEGELTRRMEIAKERRIEVSHTEVRGDTWPAGNQTRSVPSRLGLSRVSNGGVRVVGL